MSVKSSVKLQEHQKRLAEKLKYQNGIIAFHGLGSGKTLSSINAVEDSGLNADVITPASLRGNYQKELSNYLGSKHKNYNVTSYDKAVNQPKELKNDFLVLDEAHRIREIDTKRGALINNLAKNYKKRLLLTATPIVNRPSDLVNLINTANGKKITDRDSFDKAYLETVSIDPGFWGTIKGVKPGIEVRSKNLNKFKTNFKKYFDYYENASKDYPKVHEKVHRINMSETQYDTYKGLTKSDPLLAYKVRKNLPLSKQESKNLNAFSGAARQVSNTTKNFSRDNRFNIEDAPKIKAVVHSILKGSNSNPNYKSVIYSNYLESGLSPMSEYLTKHKIKHAIFNGSLNDKERKRIISQYNSGKLKTLLISSAGAEGLDLKATRALHILEPHWNDSKLDQVEGRVARYKSHSALPEHDRDVTVHRYYAEPRKTFIQKLFRTKGDTGIDEYLQNMSDKKTKLNNSFLETLK